jgi:peptidoglycan L-alanyl-D-glutamate endopeptidase CwlK
MTGKDVERIQRALGMKEKDVDGKYGNDTAKLVKAYQKRKGLKADGIVGKETWNLLF